MKRPSLAVPVLLLAACDGGAAGFSGASESSGIQPGTLTAGVWDDNLNFDAFESYVASTKALQGVPAFSADEREAARKHFAERGRRRDLDVVFVLDTTGSMGDELEYLRVEFSALAGQIQRNNPNANARWALVAYGDEGDVYVTERYDFTPGVHTFQTTLEALRTTGGGDYPEAADLGLEAAMELEWRDGNTARMLFWIADAPHHDKDNDRLTRALRAARERDIHVYPVAASGADERTERTMRGAAQFTGGRYLFITDDSGVGGAHKPPSVPCYFVTTLEDAVRRMVDIELTGVYREPDTDEIIRTGGDPHDGRCTAGGETYVVY